MAETNYMTPKQVHERWPFLTISNLGQMRFKGTGPRFLKPTPKTVIYREQDVVDFLEAAERTSTAAAI